MKSFFWNTPEWLSIFIKNSEDTDTFFDSPGFRDKVKKLVSVRGKILSICVSIEEYLDLALEFLIFDEHNNSSERFTKHIIQSGALTFYSKWKIFRNLCKEREKKVTYDSDTIGKISKAKDIRNKFAHWTFMYDWNKKLFFLEYIKDYSTKKEKIDSIDFDQILESLYLCINTLSWLFNSEEFSTDIKEIEHKTEYRIPKVDSNFEVQKKEG